MLELARTLSQGLRRCGWTCSLLNDGINFGEMTFTTESGISRWHPESANEYMGSLIHLPARASPHRKGTPCRKKPVSPFVPVYKAEATLDACVQSILAQTFCRL